MWKIRSKKNKKNNKKNAIKQLTIINFNCFIVFFIYIGDI